MGGEKEAIESCVKKRKNWKRRARLGPLIHSPEKSVDIGKRWVVCGDELNGC